MGGFDSIAAQVFIKIAIIMFGSGLLIGGVLGFLAGWLA
jgi:hypothetical protein